MPTAAVLLMFGPGPRHHHPHGVVLMDWWDLDTWRAWAQGRQYHTTPRWGGLLLARPNAPLVLLRGGRASHLGFGIARISYDCSDDRKGMKCRSIKMPSDIQIDFVPPPPGFRVDERSNSSDQCQADDGAGVSATWPHRRCHPARADVDLVPKDCPRSAAVYLVRDHYESTIVAVPALSLMFIAARTALALTEKDSADEAMVCALLETSRHR